MLRRIILIGLCICSLPLLGREFPLCMYGVSNPADLPLLKQAGFTCVQSYQSTPEKLAALARAAQKEGLKIVFYPNKILGTSYEKEAKNWPVLAWYLVDEPDVHRWSRERVLEAHQKAKKAFKNHPTALVIGQGKTAVPFYDLPDIMMMDWYPVPHLPLTSFGDNVRYTKEGLAKTNMQDHPLWGVVQIFDWKNYEQYRSDDDRIGRLPTEDEIRFMSYDGIFNGATGLFFFTFNHLKKPLPQSAPAFWAYVTSVTKELAQLRPVFENNKQVANPVEVQDPLQMITYEYKKHKYSILINRSNVAQTVPAELLRRKYKAQFNRQKAAQIPPYGVWVLKY